MNPNLLQNVLTNSVESGETINYFEMFEIDSKVIELK